MSANPAVYVTVTVTEDTPVDVGVNPQSVLIALGPDEYVSLEFQTVGALERFRDQITAGIESGGVVEPTDQAG